MHISQSVSSLFDPFTLLLYGSIILNDSHAILIYNFCFLSLLPARDIVVNQIHI